VDYNAAVTKGQLIAEMDRVTLQSELASQRATYSGAKAEYEYQKKNYERNKGLHEKGLISDTDYEQSLYNYEKAKSSFESSQASLAKAERNLSYATITSPIDGVVISRDVEEGQTVASGFETPTLFTIAADLTQMQVVADVDEADIGGVEEGQRATFTVDAYPNDVFEGIVTQIRLGDASSTSTSSCDPYLHGVCRESISFTCPYFMFALTVLHYVIIADQGFLRCEAECTCRYREHVLSVQCVDRDISRQAGFQFQVRVMGGDHYFVCDYGSRRAAGAGTACVRANIKYGHVKEILSRHTPCR